VLSNREFTTAPGRKFIDTLDGFRKKRNVSSYDAAEAILQKSFPKRQESSQLAPFLVSLNSGRPEQSGKPCTTNLAGPSLLAIIPVNIETRLLPDHS
jgi:hypothetical protein